MSYPSKLKDAAARLDYVWDWSAWVTGGETITAVTWVVPSGITQDTATFTDTTATIWLTGGALNATYLVTCRITTSAGRVDDRSMNIKVVAR